MTAQKSWTCKWQDKDTSFIQEVRMNGYKIRDYFFDDGDVDAPYRELHYIYQGKVYRIYDYRFNMSKMTMIGIYSMKSKSVKKTVTPMDEVNKAFAESKKTIKL